MFHEYSTILNFCANKLVAQSVLYYNVLIVDYALQLIASVTAYMNRVFLFLAIFDINDKNCNLSTVLTAPHQN